MALFRDCRNAMRAMSSLATGTLTQQDEPSSEPGLLQQVSAAGSGSQGVVEQMAYAVSAHILDQPTESGVSRIYRYLGDGISGVSARDRVGDWIELVQSRHEELSAFGSVL